MNPLLGLTEYLTQLQSDYDKNIAAANNRASATPEGKLEKSFMPKFALASLAKIQSNPLINMGVDMASNFIQATVQGLIQSALQKGAAFAGKFESTVSGFFSAMALVSTGGVEIAMALARNNAKLIVEKLKTKAEVLTKIQEEVTALNNAVDILLNSSPFFNDYLRKLLRAYALVDNSNKDLKSVAAILKGTKFYNQRLYGRAVSNLEAAVELILPDKTANISGVRSGSLNDVIRDRTVAAKEGLAAAMAIPMITLRIARLMVQYATIVNQINVLIALFLKALNDYIAAYTRNTAIDQMTLNHINAAIEKLDPVQKSMFTTLFPTDGREARPQYPLEVMGYASTWGVQLSTIITWLKQEPGVASKELDLTAESVARYQRACTQILGIQDIRFGRATLKAIDGQESVRDTSLKVLQLVTVANTVVVSTAANTANSVGLSVELAKKVPQNVRESVRQVGDIFRASSLLDTRLKAALTPFIKTENNAERAAEKTVRTLGKFAKSLGLDRAGDLLAKADITALFAMTATTATFIGSALAGVGSILKFLDTSPNATDEQRRKLQAANDELSRQKVQKEIAANASSADTSAQYVANETASKKLKDSTINQAKQIAVNTDTPGSSDIKDQDSVQKGFAKVVRAFDNLITGG